MNPAKGEVPDNRDAVAFADFDARNPDELSFQAGDRIRIKADAADPGWYVGELAGKTGVVPVTHINFIGQGPASAVPFKSGGAVRMTQCVSQSRGIGLLFCWFRVQWS